MSFPLDIGVTIRDIYVRLCDNFVVSDCYIWVVFCHIRVLLCHTKWYYNDAIKCPIKDIDK